MKPIIPQDITFKSLIEGLDSPSKELLSARRLMELGLPNKKNEEYHYFDINPLMRHEWTRFKPEHLEIERSDSIIMTDGVVTTMPNVEGLSVEYSNSIDIDSEHFDPLYYMGHLLSPELVSIHFKKDAKVKIEHRFTQKEKLISYRCAIYIDNNIDVQISEYFDGDGANESLILSGYDIFVSRDARVRLIKNQTLETKGYMPILSHRIKVEPNASVELFTFDFGAGKGLQLIKTELDDNSSINANHLLFVKEDHSKRGTISKIIHKGESSKSTQRAKNILQDLSRGIFDALIKIEPSGKYTKASQNSAAVLLNDDAYMVSKPQLEIYIDDVEANHGSTIGQMDKDQLFYLRSRGIDEKEARKMLLLAFANEMIDAVEDKSIQEEIHVGFEKAYYGKTLIECISTCENCLDEVIDD